MDKDTIDILKRQDRLVTKVFYLSCIISVLLFFSIISNNINVSKMSEVLQSTTTEMTRINSAEKVEAIRLYFETDYGYGEYDNSVNQEVEVNN